MLLRVDRVGGDGGASEGAVQREMWREKKFDDPKGEGKAATDDGVINTQSRIHIKATISSTGLTRAVTVVA
jgi:hypothetical protein